MPASKAATKEVKAVVLVRIFAELLRGGKLHMGTDDPMKMALWLGVTQLLKEYADEFIPARDAERGE